jgi:hypothetical protein
MRKFLATKTLGLVVFLSMLMAACSSPQISNPRTSLTGEQAKELVAVYLYWEPSNPWQRFSGAGRGVVYENSVAIGSLRYGQHAVIYTTPGRKAYLVNASDTYSLDETSASKIALVFEAVSAGSEMAVIFSQDRNRASGALAKPEIKVMSMVPDAIRNSTQAFRYWSDPKQTK